MALEAVEVAEVDMEAREAMEEDMVAKGDMVVVKVATEAKGVMVVAKVVMAVVLEEDTEMEDTVEAKEDMAVEANKDMVATKHLSPFGPLLHSEI